MVQHHDARPTLGDALCFAHQLSGVTDDADDMADENRIERIVGKGKLKCIGLKDRRPVEASARGFFSVLRGASLRKDRRR